MINFIHTKKNIVNNWRQLAWGAWGMRRISGLIGFCITLFSVQAMAVTLQDLQFSALPGDQVEINLTFDQAPPDPSGYSIEKPARISLDLVGVTSALSAKKFSLDVGNARSVTVVESNDRARLIINLDRLVSYRADRKGNKLRIIVGEGVDTRLAAASGEAQNVFSSQPSGVKKAQKEDIEEIDFLRGEQGNGQVVISLADPNADIDMREEGGRIIVEVLNSVLPERLRRRLDVTDFATPVKRVDAVQESGHSKLIIEAVGDYEYLAYQADNIFTLDVKPVSAKELERKRKETFIYTGEKLSLNFQDIEVRSVLQLIADFTSLNLVASDTVGGNITLRLQNVPWDQALELILKTKGLDKRKVGNVMLVAPADEIAAREKLELEANRQVEELAPMSSEFIQINYAKASDLRALLTGTAEGSSLLSSRGSLMVDERTNTILIQDTAAKIQEVRDVVSVLDVPVRQVIIEARIVIANTSFAKEIGVAWGLARTDASSSGINFVTGNRNALVNQLNNDDVVIDDTMVVDLGVAGNNATNLTLGILNFARGLLALEISALEAEGGGEIISTPKVLTADQQTARISSGTEVPYQEASSSGAATTSFKEAVLSLEVTPQITPDDSIIMNIKVNKDSVGDLFGISQVPSILTNEIQTTVLVDNGDTAVLGGIFEVQSDVQEVMTPFLGNLPIIGRLFKRTVDGRDKQELLIFITPTIVNNILAQ